MTYENMQTISGIAGLVLFMAMFAGVLAYVFWPGNQKSFDEASRIPLDKDPDDLLPGDENGR